VVCSTTRSTCDWWLLGKKNHHHHHWTGRTHHQSTPVPLAVGLPVGRVTDVYVKSRCQWLHGHKWHKAGSALVTPELGKKYEDIEMTGSLLISLGADKFFCNSSTSRWLNTNCKGKHRMPDHWDFVTGRK